MGSQQYLECIKAVRPDIIICTYPTVAGALAKLRLNNVLQVPVATVVTDYAVHSQWIHAGIDLYIVGCEDVCDGLVARGVDPERIKITGIPVSPKFERDLDRSEAFSRLGLNAGLPTILIMGGAYGVLDDLKRICKLLANEPIPLQTVVICGKNENLYESLDGIVQNSRNPVLRYGFVNNVEEFLTAADIVITKAGGLTVSEALAKGVPMLIYKPIPGQEKSNTIFLEKSGAAISVNNRTELEETLLWLLKNPQEIAKMREAAIETLPGRAAEQAIQHILRLINESEEKQVMVG
jgi:processive 1,2-diacylglycerol beta-glucosyltransferase